MMQKQDKKNINAIIQTRKHITHNINTGVSLELSGVESAEIQPKQYTRYDRYAIVVIYGGQNSLPFSSLSFSSTYLQPSFTPFGFWPPLFYFFGGLFVPVHSFIPWLK